ncbi:YdiU family protein [Paenibacillus sp. PK3_47]|uniref:protein adenylyltransferase SelO n=1 Tax=Paenibacillus sp. PK3_47 TaxID=2072642 RepID=UPI00201D3822|nr:YdiU family protein [Paenibacillus sp. PK3_47]UQZ36223.1 YdiU family protein [Paenibacillus sp. PK3_47]
MTDDNNNNQTTSNTGWNFDNSYATLPEAAFTLQKPVPVRAPRMIIFNESLAEKLGLSSEELKSEAGVPILAGNQIPEGALPLAQAYAGHQFGHFTMLGDGRAVLLVEQITPDGERYDIQLKGSGRTPYSRGGDGRAALGPMLREYIISEAMHGLGIPTTRSLAVVATGEPVIRETHLPGAILTRIAASHLRVGTFQYFAARGVVQDLRTLADYTINRHYKDAQSEENPYLALLQRVIRRQAELIAKWQLVGFIHGVMNTDNMAISGQSIDYGPCAFMDVYDPATVFSSIDRQGRYAYGNQPEIAGWNLARFAETLLPLLHEDEEQAVRIAEEAVSDFYEIFNRKWLAGMRSKLGIFNEEPEDEHLVQELLTVMHNHRADYTHTFRALTLDQPVETALNEAPEFTAWKKLWQARLGRQQQSAADSQQLMRHSNPAVIPRNQRVEEALEAAVEREDYSVMENLLKVLARPYAHSPEQEEYAAVPAACNQRYRTYCGT